VQQWLGASDVQQIYREEFQLEYFLHWTKRDVEHCSVFERQEHIRMLVDQFEKEKEAMKGEKRGQSLLRKPMPGEAHGSTDMEKLHPIMGARAQQRATRASSLRATAPQGPLRISTPE